MKLSARIEELLRAHDQPTVYTEAAKALEQADTHPFAVAREDVAWIGAALALAAGIAGARRGGVVHTVRMADEIRTADRLG